MIGGALVKAENGYYTSSFKILFKYSTIYRKKHFLSYQKCHEAGDG